MPATGVPAPRRGFTWGAVAWIAILVAIGAVQIVRAQWFDAGAFLLVAVLLAAAGRARPTASRSQPPRAAILRLVVGALLLAGVVAALLPRHSFAMQALLLATGALVLGAAWPQGAAAGGLWSPGLKRLARAWAVIVIAGCLWELGEFIAGRVAPTEASFALSDLVDPLLAGWPGRTSFVALWIAAGVFLVTRRRG